MVVSCSEEEVFYNLMIKCQSFGPKFLDSDRHQKQFLASSHPTPFSLSFERMVEDSFNRRSFF